MESKESIIYADKNNIINIYRSSFLNSYSSSIGVLMLKSNNRLYIYYEH